MEKKITTIWQFPKISPIKQREGYYCKESIQHPAKMPTYLAQAIILTYTKEDDLILDPMAGIGTTVIEAIKLGRNAIGVEYEKKFAEICNKNLRLTKAKQNSQTAKGMFVKGDARELNKVLVKHKEKIDSVVFSPPYSDTPVISYNNTEWTKEFQKQLEGKGYIEWQGKKYTEKDWRALNHGRIDGRTMRGMKKGSVGYGQVDSIITSPPYSEGIGHSQGKKAGKDIVGKDRFVGSYSKDNKNIGNLRHGQIDSIITSPPYSEGIGHGGGIKNRAIERSKGIWLQGKNSYSQSKNNIGETRGKNYLSEMLKVYQECYKVLKEDGLMILVIKNFRRKGEEIDLRGDTIQLCRLAGFKFFQTCIHVLNGASFWQINHTRKTPYLMLNLTEYILVFRKA